MTTEDEINQLQTRLQDLEAEVTDLDTKISAMSSRLEFILKTDFDT